MTITTEDRKRYSTGEIIAASATVMAAVVGLLPWALSGNSSAEQATPQVSILLPTEASEPLSARVMFESVELAAVKKSGLPWDLADEPDPHLVFVNLSTNEKVEVGPFKDVFAVTLNLPIDTIKVRVGDVISVSVYDRDLSSESDLAGVTTIRVSKHLIEDHTEVWSFDRVRCLSLGFREE